MLNVLFAALVAASIGDPQPTPTPSAAPFTLAPAGDPSVMQPEYQPVPDYQPVPYMSQAPQPSAAPDASSSATPEPSEGFAWDTYQDTGPITLTVRACLDTNNDQRCTLGEGIAGMPVHVVDATIGDVLASGETGDDGRFAFSLDLTRATQLSVDVPFLAYARTASSGQQGVEVVLPRVELPARLP